MKVPLQNESPKKTGFGLKIERIPLGTRDIFGRKTVIFKHFLSWMSVKPRTFEGRGGQISLIFIAIFGVQELIWAKKVQIKSDGFGPRGSFSAKNGVLVGGGPQQLTVSSTSFDGGAPKTSKNTKNRVSECQIWDLKVKKWNFGPNFLILKNLPEPKNLQNWRFLDQNQVSFLPKVTDFDGIGLLEAKPKPRMFGSGLKVPTLHSFGGPL